MAIAGYIRVSSRAQDHASQRLAIERLAASRGEKVERWYQEKRSAKTVARPELARVREHASKGEITKLYVFRIDRLTRTGIKDTLGVLEELRGAGVELVTVADGFDMNGPCAEVIIAVMSWASKMEYLAIGERISAARERVEAEGRTWGRQPKMTPAQKATATRMREQGRSVREIAMALGIGKSIVGRAVAS